MALDQLHLCNLALSAIGEGPIQSLTENSVAAEQCSLWYEPVRDMVFAAAPWQALEAYKRLPLLVERDDDDDWLATDPTPGYIYAYGLPSDMVRPRFLADYSLFKLGSVNGTRALMANATTPILTYTSRSPTESSWDIGLQIAVYSTLAAHICIPITGKRTRMVDAFSLAEQKVLEARTQDANSRQDTPQESIPDWIAARGFGNAAPPARFVYPPGPFSLMTGTNVG